MNSMEYDYENDIIKNNEYEFNDTIIKKGKDYYENGMVLSVIKSNNKYTAKVAGSTNESYTVNVEYDKDEDYYDYDCTCPCEYPCKHIYAVLMSIKNKNYIKATLKKEIDKTGIDMHTLISKIPAKELKDYLLNAKYKDSVAFEMGAFNDYFKKYLPLVQYEYYYNNIYNSLIMNDDYAFKKIITESINDIKENIRASLFSESYKIVKAIIEAYHDSKILNEEKTIIDLMPSLAMYLRVTYRKSNDNIKENIDKWIKHLEDNNYYDNFYLEDMILSIK